MGMTMGGGSVRTSSRGNSIVRKTIEGEIKQDKVEFPRQLPNYYLIFVNGVTFIKGHFAEIDPFSIELKNYIQTGDVVQLEYLELL